MTHELAGVRPPKGVREIAERLEDAGFETWCVGGAVRDALLGRAHLDWDLATAATPDQVRSIFRRTVPKGLEFGTLGVFDRSGVMHEVTTFRRDVRTDGRHAEVEFGVSLDEDLARRDFTINAIAYSPRRQVMHDPFAGRTDLERGIVRAVGDPAARLKEDWLRALRALRFAARFEFEIDAETWRAIEGSAPFLGRLSRERVREELEKTMQQVKRPSHALELWRRSGALAALIPELAPAPAVVFQAADSIATPDDTARVELASSRETNRLAALFLGTPGGATRQILRNLRFSNREADWIGHLAASWSELEPRMRDALIRADTVAERDIRTWAAIATRTRVRDLWRVTHARWSAERDEGGTVPTAERSAGLYRQALRIAYRDPVSLDDLAVDGNDLSDAGIPPGPQVGATLRWLLRQVLEDPSRNSRQRLLDLVRTAPHDGPGATGDGAR